MNKFDIYLITFGPLVFILFLLYLVFDYYSTNQNAFWNKWTKKTLWFWLPFYGLQRLIKEVILKTKK